VRLDRGLAPRRGLDRRQLFAQVSCAQREQLDQCGRGQVWLHEFVVTREREGRLQLTIDLCEEQ
jgi:hypothetical protein